jgi:hypothetical protein
MKLLHREAETVLTNSTNYVRDRDSFDYAQEISKPFGVLEQVLDWCKEELTGDWRWQLIDVSTDRRPGRYCFFFDSERDCLAFTMKWA